MRTHLQRSTRAATAVAALLLSAGAAASSAEAATYCVGAPAACPADAVGHFSELQPGLDAAKGAAGPDQVLIGKGTFKTVKGFQYVDKGPDGNSVKLVGEGPATVLSADTATKAETFATLKVATLSGSRVEDLRVVMPDASVSNVQMYGIRSEGELAVEDVVVEDVEDAGTGSESLGSAGVALLGGGGVSRSTVHVSGEATAVITTAGSAVLSDNDLRGRHGVAGAKGSTVVIRRNRIQAREIGYFGQNTSLAIESSLVRVTGAGGKGLFFENDVSGAKRTVKASHVTLVALGKAGSEGVVAETPAAAEIGVDIDNSIVHGFERGMVRRATDPKGVVKIGLANVNYPSANDYSAGDGETLGTSVMNHSVGFVDPDNGDFRLPPGSKLIDKGRAGSLVPLTGTDLAGKPRSVGASRDLGAYEYQAAAPKAVITAPGTAIQGQAVKLSGAASKDDDAGDEIVAWSWSFGDGTSAEGRDVTHAWSSPGVRVVTLKVKDTTGKTDTTTLSVSVGAEPVKGPGPNPGPDPGPDPAPNPGPIPGPEPAPNPGPEPASNPGPTAVPASGPTSGLKPGQTPGPTAVAAPGPTTSPAADRTAPVLSGLRRRGRALRLTVDEAAKIEVQLERKVGAGYRVLGAPKRFQVQAGSTTLRNAVRRIRRGRARITVVATDAAGNRSLERLALRVR